MSPPYERVPATGTRTLDKAVTNSGDVVVGLLADRAEKLLGPLDREANTGLASAANEVAPTNYELYRLVLAELEARQQAKRKARR